MKRFSDKVNVSIVAVLAWMCIELIEMKTMVNRVDERTVMLIEIFKKAETKSKNAAYRMVKK